MKTNFPSFRSGQLNASMCLTMVSAALKSKSKRHMKPHQKVQGDFLLCESKPVATRAVKKQDSRNRIWNDWNYGEKTLICALSACVQNKLDIMLLFESNFMVQNHYYSNRNNVTFYLLNKKFIYEMNCPLMSAPNICNSKATSFFSN